MSGRASAIVAVVLVACGGSPTAGPASQSRQGSPPSTALVSLGCSLPIANVGRLSDEVYFVSVPTGAMTAPKTTFARVPGSPALRRTVADPVLYGQSDDATYDWPLRRWVPARFSAISPDGTQYAYAKGGSGPSVDIHIVNIATGKDHVAATGDNFWPLVFNKDGVYLTQRTAPAGLFAGGGIFLLDPITDKVREVHAPGAVEAWQVISGKFAYGGGFNPAAPAGSGETSNELIRLDMTTGAIERLAYRPGQPVVIAGTTSDGRIIASIQGGLYFVDSQAQTTLIMDADGGASIFTDRDQTWFLSWSMPRRLYSVSGNRAEHVMDFPAYTNPNSYMSLAGGCY